MKSLRFGPVSGDCADARRRVRQARFETRSSLPTSAACVVANGVRETLASVLGVPVSVRLFEPVIPDPPAWQAIAQHAMLYRVRGNVAEAVIILRPSDAISLVAAVFGEPASQTCNPRPLSPIELDVANRIACAIAANLSVVCGTRDSTLVERISEICGFVTFFELILDRPVEARIGIALSREPSPEPRGCVDIRHLAGVALTAVASLDLGEIQAAEVVRLSAGIVVPIRAIELRRCSLHCHGRRLARGTCGIRNGRFAFAAELRESA